MTCARLWSVEAARDGRIPESEAALVIRHLAACTDCAEEARRLDELRGALRALPVRTPDAVSVRREKQRLLSALDARVVAPPRRAPGRLALMFAVPAVALGLIALVGFRATRDERAAASAVDAQGAGRWSRAREGSLETITLTEGAVSLRVHRTSADERVIVKVPDGEIEDRGTTFAVEVNAGHTQRITVQEGEIEFRPAEGAAVRVHAGESWAREPMALATVPAVSASVAPIPAVSAVPPSVELAAAALAPSAPSAPSVARVTAPPSIAPPRVVRTTATPAATSTSAFQAGFHALEEGRHDDAEALLGNAETKATDDARAEDSLYLRIVAHVRAGERAEARKLARGYLQRFPRGFRRTEVEAIAR